MSKQNRLDINIGDTVILRSSLTHACFGSDASHFSKYLNQKGLNVHQIKDEHITVTDEAGFNWPANRSDVVVIIKK